MRIENQRVELVRAALAAEIVKHQHRAFWIGFITATLGWWLL